MYRITRSLTEGARKHGFRIGQVGSACVVSLAHGTNDAQKTMGVITLALIANGTVAKGSNAPVWVIVCCALAISIGTYLGGWRVIRTLGKGLILLAALSWFIFWRSRATKVDHNNVNSEWTGGVAPEKVPAETAAA